MTILQHRGTAATGGDRSPHLTHTQTHMASTTTLHSPTLTGWTSISDLLPTIPTPPARPPSCDSNSTNSSIDSSGSNSSYSDNSTSNSSYGDNSTSSSPCTSSDESCGPPSPPSEHTHNYSRAGTPVLPPSEESGKQFQVDQLIDLGHEDVVTFFLHNTRTGMERSKGTRPVQTGTQKQNSPPPRAPPGKKHSQHKPDKPKPKPSTRTAGGRKLWEFVLGLLCNPDYNPSVVRWLDIHQGVFVFVQSRDAASLWGQRRGHPTMTYEHMSRAIRHYYKRQVILRVPGKRLVYKFGPNAHGWRERVRANSTGPLADQLPTDLCLDLPQSSTVSEDSAINSPSCDDSLDESSTRAASPEVPVAMDTKDYNGVTKVTPTMATNVNNPVITPELLASSDNSAMHDAPMDMAAMPMVTREPVSMTTDSVQEVPGEMTDWFNYLHSDSAQQYTMADTTTYKSSTTASFAKAQMPSTFDPLDLEFQTGFYEGAMGLDTTDQRPLVGQTAPSKAVPEMSDHKAVMDYDHKMTANVEGVVGIGFTMKQEVDCEIPHSVLSQIEDLLRHEQLQDLEQNMWMDTGMYTASVCTNWC